MNNSTQYHHKRLHSTTHSRRALRQHPTPNFQNPNQSLYKNHYNPNTYLELLQLHVGDITLVNTPLNGINTPLSGMTCYVKSEMNVFESVVQP